MSASDLSVDISRPASNGSLVNFQTTPLSIPVSSEADITLNYAAADGPILRAAGTLDVDLFGFFRLSGFFSVQKSTDQLVLADDQNSVQDVDLLTIGGKHISAFAGVNGNSSNRMGLALSDVEFGLVMATSRADRARQWTALSAAAGSVEILGLPEITLSAEDLSVSINQPDATGKVLDFSRKMVFVKTGTDSLDGVTVDTGVTLDFEGSRGPVLEASGTLTIAVSDFFHVSGSLAVTKSSETLTLSDESSVSTDLLTIAGSGINAFAGVNYSTDSAVGLSLTDTQFALAVATDRQDNSRK
jgi:hypothetical protein